MADAPLAPDCRLARLARAVAAIHPDQIMATDEDLLNLADRPDGQSDVPDQLRTILAARP